MSETISKFYTCRNDRAFKEVFMKEESKDILTKLLESILDVKIEDIEFLNLERNVDNIHVRRKHFDLFLKTNIGKIQVEVNAEKPNYLNPRNASFIFDTYSHEVKKGDDYNEDTLVIQINLSYSLSIEELVRIYKVRDEDGNEYIKNLIIYDINMDKIKDIWYSKSRNEIEKYKYLIMLDLNQEELKNGSVTIKSVEETANGAKLIKTGENIYTGIITLDDIQKGIVHKIEMKVEWIDEEQNNKIDTELGTNKELRQFQIPITFRAIQYSGEEIIPVT